MLSAAVAALACLCCARSSLAEPHALRAYAFNNHNTKDLPSILANIEERLRVLDTVNAFQVKQARRLDVIQDKLDRMETALSLRLERAQLVAERLEHRLHMMENNVEATIKESSQKLERSQAKIVDLTVNLTNHIEKHKHLLEKVNGAYSETWRRGLLVEAMMRDGLSLVNVTRRELADGLRALARRHRDAKLSTADLEVAFSRRLNEHTQKIDVKMQSILEAQKQIVDSCQRVQLDDPTHVADVLDKLIDSLINKTASTFHELQNIQATLRNHDNKVMKLIGSGRNAQQGDATCRRLESVIRNASHTSFKETELKQLTEKFIDLTDRADAALQRLETRINEDREAAEPPSEVTAEADRLFIKLNGIKSEHESYEDWDEQDTGFFDDGGEGDLMSEDAEVLNRGSLNEKKYIKSPTTRTPHRRHLHKHPYDRGPSWKSPSP